jgi:acyl carrier protein
MQTKGSVSEATIPSRDRVLEDVKTIAGEQVGIAVENIRESSDLENDLGFDSLDKVETLMEVEEHFGIDVPDAVADDVRTIRDIVDGVMRLLDAPPRDAGDATNGRGFMIPNPEP